MVYSIDAMVCHDEESPFLAGHEDLLRNSVEVGLKVFQGNDGEIHIAMNLILGDRLQRIVNLPRLESEQAV